MRLLRVAAAVPLVLALAACGGADEPPADDPDERAPATVLDVTVWPAGRDGEERSATLTCDPVGGTHPRAEAACAALAEAPEALEDVPDDVLCTQQYGGPQYAEVRGTVAGEPVSTALGRQNGCEIARWDALRPLLDVENR
jgi:Subtilisin inhibitor-like